jgi:hypothetical protein
MNSQTVCTPPTGGLLGRVRPLDSAPGKITTDFLLLAVRLVAGLVLSGSPVFAQAGILYVEPSGHGNCHHWRSACELQTALDQAASGTEIWVAAGTYLPTKQTDPNDPRTATFALRNGVALYGGFAGTETRRDQRNWTTYTTILSGDLGTPGNTSDNSYHVVTSGGNDATAVLDGFTITGGNADGSGGGLHISSGGPTLSNLIFSGNTAAQNGGGLFNLAGQPTLTNVIFSGNTAFTGGGMHNEEGGNTTLINVVFSGNFATGGGGGLFNYGTKSTLINVTFSGNTSGGQGGGINNNYRAADITLINCILWGNTPDQLYRTIQFGSLATISYSLIQNSGGSGPAWNAALGTDGGGNIEADPQFMSNPNPPGPDGQWGTPDDDYGDLHLRMDSPAIDVGNNDALPADSLDLDGDGNTAEKLPVDLDGNPRIVNGIVDMGAYESQLGNQCDLNGNGRFDLRDILPFYQACRVGKAYRQCDYDDNGRFTLRDVMLFVKYCRSTTDQEAERLVRQVVR